MALSKYEAIVTKMYRQNVFNPVKLGLANTQALYSLLDKPMDRIPTIHIAGTNGKGSVALKISRALQYSGVTTGLFVSPHVSSFRERMQVNGQLITEQEVEEHLPYIFDLCESHGIPATFFEITTALALRYFHVRNSQATVLEAGLGGRLDATNVVCPSMCVITSVGLDHTRILGNTVEAIAREKAGIMKPNIPVLVGPDVPLAVLRECAQASGSPLYTVTDILGRGAIQSDVELLNQDIARAALVLLKHMAPHAHITFHDKISNDTIEKGLQDRPPCRFECVKIPVNNVHVEVVMDMGHNPPALSSFQQKVQAYANGRGVRIVAGFSRDKDLQACVQTLTQIAPKQKIHFVQAAHPRATPVDILHKLVEKGTFADSFDDEYTHTPTPSLAQTVHHALYECAKSNELLCICGTVFIMAEARAALGFVEPRDSDVLVKSAGAHIKDSQEYFLDTNVSGSAV